MRRALLAAAVALVACAAPRPAAACTAFRLEGPQGPTVGKCYDWHMGQGLVLWNKRGLHKTALPVLPSDRPAQWQARYASLTFNQYGRELPNGGMNEAGLIVEVLWLAAARHPPADERPTVNELQWIQYQLDSFATVDEVVESAPRLRVARVHGSVHYLVCDKTGACAALEHLGGRTVVTRGADLKTPTLTNDPYGESLAQLQKHQGFGGRREVPGGGGSLDRFVRAASLVQKRAGEADGRAAAIQVLESVHGASSQWHIVYDPQQLRVDFRSREHKGWKTVDLARLRADGSCRTPVRMLDLNTDQSGDVTERLVEYTDAADQRLVSQSFGQSVAGTDLRKKLGPEVLAALVRYPNTLACTAP